MDEQPILSDRPSSPFEAAAKVAAAAIPLFAIYNSLFIGPPEMITRAIFFGLAALVVFLQFSTRNRWLGLLLCAGVVTSVGFLYWDYDQIILRQGLPSQVDIVLGLIFFAVLLEAARRSVGWVLLVVGLLFLLYPWYGQFLPGILAHRGYPIGRIINIQYLSLYGAFSSPLGVFANIIVLYVFFGSLLVALKGDVFFTQLALALTGRMVGGPALTAVVGSAVMGTISGSAASNVLTTGPFTIPLMRRLGYSATFAAGVEAAASTGGLIMPPIMGAAAFMMADLIGEPYANVMRYALLPAILYYVSVGLQIYLRSHSLGIRNVPEHQIPPIGQVLRQGGHMLVPLLVIVYTLVVLRASPAVVGVWAIFATIIVGMLHPNTRCHLRDLLQAAVQAGKQSVQIALACTIAGVIVGSISMTGLGPKIAFLILRTAGDSLFPALILTMLGAIIFGMGMPAVAAYVLLAVLIAPALVEMGVPTAAAHLFVVYYGFLSAITPPYALASFAAAGLTGDSPGRISIQAMRLAIVAFIVPFFFVYNPSLLMIGSLTEIASATLTSIIGAATLAVSAEGWFQRSLTLSQRILLALSGLLLIHPNYTTDLIAVALLGVFLVSHRKGLTGLSKASRQA